MTLGHESDYSKGIKQRTVTILVYKGNESTPRISLPVTRYSTEKEFSGVPIGTVIAWPGANAPTTNGTWLECNGQSCATYPALSAVLGKSTVPDYRGRFLETDTIPGTVKEAGLPNIRGSTWGTFWRSYANPSGPFTYAIENSRGTGDHPSSNFSSYWIYFDASRCSSVYGKSTTVQPPAVTVRWLIKAV